MRLQWDGILYYDVRYSPSLSNFRDSFINFYSVRLLAFCLIRKTQRQTTFFIISSSLLILYTSAYPMIFFPIWFFRGSDYHSFIFFIWLMHFLDLQKIEFFLRIIHPPEHLDLTKLCRPSPSVGMRGYLQTLNALFLI